MIKINIKAEKERFHYGPKQSFQQKIKEEREISIKTMIG